jgi:hypothetical protein
MAYPDPSLYQWQEGKVSPICGSLKKTAAVTGIAKFVNITPETIGFMVYIYMVYIYNYNIPYT